MATPTPPTGTYYVLPDGRHMLRLDGRGNGPEWWQITGPHQRAEVIRVYGPAQEYGTNIRPSRNQGNIVDLFGMGGIRAFHSGAGASRPTGTGPGEDATPTSPSGGRWERGVPPPGDYYVTPSGTHYLRVDLGNGPEWFVANGPHQRAEAERVYGSPQQHPDIRPSRVAGNIPDLFGMGGIRQYADRAGLDAGSGPPPGTPGPGDTDEPTTPGRDFAREAELLFPWMPKPLLDAFTDAWIELGDPNLALAEMRRHRDYDTYFPGNRRPDGSLKLSEQDYFQTVDAYKAEIAQYGIDPRIWQEKYGRLIEGDISPRELAERLRAANDRLVENMDEVKQFYATNYGVNLTNQALFASFVDPEIGQQVLERRLSISEIGGEALMAGFDRSIFRAERLSASGLTQEQARSLFQQARSAVPHLSALGRRFNAPGQFGLTQFEDALALQDDTAQRWMQRRMSEERSTFTRRLGFEMSEEGGLSGLQQQ